MSEEYTEYNEQSAPPEVERLRPNIVLIGMPGCGKTTLGRYLAEMLQWEFIDADEEVEKDSRCSIAALFAKGEGRFRDEESATVARLALLSGKVLAMGGGVVERPVNIENLRRTGIIVYIDRSPADIVRDVRTDTRPLLAEGAYRIYALYAERAGLYEAAADIVVKNHGALPAVLRKLLVEVREKLAWW